MEEDRTQVAHMLLKYHERGILSPEIVGKLWQTLFADLVEEAGLTEAFDQIYAKVKARAEKARKEAESKS